ncbi:MAG: hypothetical protein AB1941_23060 [Gemmatimonadota bacterium]
MEILLGVGVGGLRFGMGRGEVERVLGSPAQTVDYGEERTGLGYGRLDALVHARLGLVAVTLSRGPALLGGEDLFALPPERLPELLAERGEVEARRLDDGGEVVAAPGLGLHLYLDDESGALAAVEAFAGTWRGGRPA